MDDGDRYDLVQLRSGAHTLRSRAHGETMHPGLGPAAEATALYVEASRLRERLEAHPEEFVIWDVGLGAAANALTILRAAQEVQAFLRLVSFERTLEPLRFAFDHRDRLGYFAGYEPIVQQILAGANVRFPNGRSTVEWCLHLGDFPSLLRQGGAGALPKPHLVQFDPWSPARNPAMWTGPLFADLFRLLDPGRACGLATYSRSTMLRVALLLAGFWVGVGPAAGRKEETTVAANQRAWVQTPLDSRWLERARRSEAAEPLWEPVWRRAALTTESWERLRSHPQFL